MISYRIRLAGVGRRLDREHEARQWLAHATAALMRMETLPTLESLRGKPAVAKRQTPAEMKSVFAAMRAAANG